MTYDLRIKSSAKREIKKLPKTILPRIKSAIDNLAIEPRPNGVKKLKGVKAELYRIRVDKYRIVYEIHDNKLIIIIVSVAYRKDIYASLSANKT